MVSYRKPPFLNNSEIIHKCSTKEDSSGSPILLINNQKLIGIHYGSNKHYEYNKGTLLIYSIIEFENIEKNIFLIYKEGKKEELNNYIIAEIYINNNKNKNIRKINSFEQFYRE